MQMIQRLIIKLAGLFLVILGAACMILPINDDVLFFFSRLTTDWLWGPFGWTYGWAIGVLGLLTIVPLYREKRSKNTISFPGAHGDVTIELDSVEATLARVVSKMPVVKKIRVSVTPSEDNRRAQVTAHLWMYKSAESSSAREIANRVADHLMDTAVNILGVEEVTTVDVFVRGIIPGKITAQKPEPQPEPRPASAETAVPAPTPGDEPGHTPEVSGADMPPGTEPAGEKQEA